MNHKITIILVLIALAGIFLLGRGITGYVISQTCCFPPDCSEEYMCEAAKELSSPEDTSNAYIGVLLLIMTLSLYAILQRKHH